MNSRYNPHSLQKQARKWPVSLSIKDLSADLEFRTRQIWDETTQAQLDPFACDFKIDQEFVDEYGIDCCRIATIEAQNLSINQVFLESSFKWLAKISDHLNDSKPGTFSAKVWFEKALQAKDHILTRDKQHAGLACIKSAAKISPPHSHLSDNELELVYGCLYPFAPVISQAFWSRSENPQIPSMKKLLLKFPELVAIRYSLEKGGWHWGVFARDKFSSSPIETILAVKWVKIATAGKKLEIKNTSEGHLICFS